MDPFQQQPRPHDDHQDATEDDANDVNTHEPRGGGATLPLVSLSQGVRHQTQMQNLPPQGLIYPSILGQYLNSRSSADQTMSQNAGLAAFPPTIVSQQRETQTTTFNTHRLQLQLQEHQQPNESHEVNPWSLYEGTNIATACAAANAEGEGHDVDDATSTHSEESEKKRRRRASNRLIAWQSRERKRIELEALQERKEDLESRNVGLRTENENLRSIIQRLQHMQSARLLPPQSAAAGVPIDSVMTHVSSNSGVLNAMSLLNQYQHQQHMVQDMRARRLRVQLKALFSSSRSQHLQELLLSSELNRQQLSDFNQPNSALNQLQSYSGLLGQTNFVPLFRNNTASPSLASASAQFIQRPDLFAFSGRDLPNESVSDTSPYYVQRVRKEYSDDSNEEEPGLTPLKKRQRRQTQREGGDGSTLPSAANRNENEDTRS